MKIKAILAALLSILACSASAVGLLRGITGLVPVITAQTLYTYSPASNAQAVGTLSATNSPTSFAITAGNAAGDFAISNAGAITVTTQGATDLAGAVEEVDFTLTVTATNSGGTSTGALIPIKVYADGFAGAPSCAVQNATLFNGYHANGVSAARLKGNGYQPAWNMPGVDYCVGYATGTTLNDPSVASLPSGCTYAAGAHTVTCVTASVTVQNLDFSLNGGVQLIVQANNITVQNNKFGLSSNSLDLIRINSGGTNATIQNNVLDQGCKLPNLDAIITQSGTPTGLTIKYNSFLNAGADMIGASGGTTTIKYNYMALAGCYAGGGTHPDFLQHSGGSTATDIIAFNTWYENGPVVAGQGQTYGDNSVQTVGTTNEFNYNALISNGSVSAISYWIRVFLPGLNGAATVSIQNNFADISQAFGFAYPGSSNVQTTWANNTNMVTGAAFSNSP